MKLFALEQVNLWGDYGDVLISGLYRREKSSSLVLLCRSGPFLPPITFPHGKDGDVLVVSDWLKSEMEKESIKSLAFRKVTFEKIVPIRWEEWDWVTARPKQRPASGEPEDYLAGPHSEETALKMGPAWECVSPEYPFVFANWLSEPAGVSESEPTLLVDRSQVTGLCRSSFGGPFVVDDAIRAWLQARVPEWVLFRQLVVAVDPSAAQRVQTQRSRNELEAPHLTSGQYRARALALCQKNSYAVPPGLSRTIGAGVSRYCVVLQDQTPAKLSAASYDSCAAVAAYLDHNRRLQPSSPSTFTNILVYDLETGRCLRYLGNRKFEQIENDA